MKNGAAHGETRFNPKHSYIEANKMFKRCETTRTSSRSLEDWGDLSLLSSID
jgi:hypothetical protein